MECLAAALPECELGGPLETQALGEVAHDGKDAGSVDALHGQDEIGLQVAVSDAVPPGVHVVIVPDGRVDEGEEVGHYDIANKDGGRNLAEAPEERERHETSNDGRDGESDPGDLVGNK